MLPSTSKERRASTSVETRAGDDFEDFKAKIDKDFVDGTVQFAAAVFAIFFAPSDGFFNERLVFGHASRCENQRRVGRGIGRMVFFDLFKFPGVGDDGAEFLELV